ncbi:MAG: capsule assembly Wzi family protein [Cyclobacteriaceae bacterium]
MNRSMKSFRCINLILLIIGISYPASAQIIVPGDYSRDYYDLLLFKDTSLNKPINHYPSIIKQFHQGPTPSWNPWGDNFATHFDNSHNKFSFSLIDPVFRYNYITKTPRSYNDGAQWNGRGSNLFLSFGFVGNAGILHYSFAPNLMIAENKDFVIPSNPWSDRSEYSYPFNRYIDWVQRYGSSTFTQFDWGQSEIRLIYKKFTVGLTTENFRWGVSQFAPLLMSYNAAGFPHLDLGTNVPVITKIGRFEGRAFWGRTVASDYFDNNSTNESGYITGFNLGYQPSFFPQLNVGINRVMNTRWSDGELSGKDFFAMFLQNTHKDFDVNDIYDQMMSVFLDFSFSEVGFRTYIEYARNDFPGNLTEFLEAPDRSRAYTLGLMKTFDLADDKLIKALFESTVLSANRLKALPSGNPTYYVHNQTGRGYTNKGQIMGAGIGPGSNANLIQLELYQPSGKWGASFTRIRFNDDYFISQYGNQGLIPTPADIEISLGMDYLRFIGKWSVNPNFSWNYRKNWYYQDDVEVSNFFLGANLSYRL